MSNRDYDIAIGSKYNMLTIISDLGLLPTRHGLRRMVSVRCDCGIVKEMKFSSIKNDHTKSCGCFNLAIVTERATKHGLAKHPLYQKWLGIKKRCFNPAEKSFKDYGARGITMCDEWVKDFKAFYDWSLNNGYAQGLEIDRKDTNGNYEPSNCRYVTRIINASNKRSNRNITFNGETLTLTRWAERLGMRYETLRYRLNKKWPIDRVFQP